MFIIRWIIEKLAKFFSSKAGKIAAWIGVGVGAGAAAYGGVEIGKAVKLSKRAQKIRDEALQRHEEHYNKVQSALEAAGNKKLAVVKSFEDFANQMEKLQGRPEFADIMPNDCDLPKFTAEDLKVISNKVALAVEGAAFAGAGAGIGIAAYGLNVFAFGPGVLFAGVGILVAGEHIKKKAIENNKQAKLLSKEVKQIVAQYDELTDAAENLTKQLDDIYSQYQRYFGKMKKILAKKTQWNDLAEKEQRVIKDTVMLVGTLFELCKIELVVKERKTESINTEAVKKSEVTVDKTLKRTKKKFLIFG
ncbi:MAG: hypothetical protein E7582_01195 [Ruminococcaceae bacterium]|nr:hypothetical protein [Oscillospiraceae bacterium]